MRALLLAALTPLAIAQTVEVAPPGRCDAAVSMPALDLEAADPASRPGVLEGETVPAPMPNLCDAPVAVIVEGDHLVLPPRSFGDFHNLEAAPFRRPFRRFGPGASLDGALPWSQRYRLGLEDGVALGLRPLPSPLADPLVAPPGERP